MGNVIVDGLKTVLLASVGAVAVTAEKAGEIINDLVKKGELTVEQGKVLNEELKQNIKSKCKDAADAVSSACSDSPAEDVLTRLDSLSPEELDKVKEKLAQMEQDGADAE